METIDTSTYMIAGFIVFSIVFFGYVAFLYYRWKKVAEEERMLDEIKK